jgi:protein-S-isoprenylcysteine O-methyltransferase Ste14
MIFFNVVLFALCHLSFIWAALFFFKTNDENAKRGKQVVSIVGGLALATQIWFFLNHHSSNPTSIGLGTVLFILSFGLFWWAYYVQRGNKPSFAMASLVPDQILMNGPYASVRHPFYLAYSLAWLGGAVSTSWWLIFTLIAMQIVYYISAKKEEASILAGNYKERYFEYKKRTSMFFPYIL